MKTLQKGIAKVLFYVISGALLLYAASRSLDFINGTLSGQNQIIGYLALAATSGGMVAWLMIFLYGAKGTGQATTSIIMVVIDLLGEISLFTFDTLYRSGQNGLTKQMTPDEIQTVVLVLSGVIALNILATVVFHLVEPENIRRLREEFVKHHLENEALKHIEKHGEEIARTLAPELAEQWKNEFVAKYSSLQSMGLGTMNKKDDKKSKNEFPEAEQTNEIEAFAKWVNEKYPDTNNVNRPEGMTAPLPLFNPSRNGHN